MRTLQADADALRGGLAFSAADRYQALIYPEFACAADYLPAEALVFFCDHGNLRRSAQRAQEELGMMLDSLLQSGLLCGELCDFSADWEQLCGDVGFGKTEVALRAAMKAVLDGKQVAILVPTTVLAQQHYTTALNRFRGFPVNIGALSRFSTPQQQRKVLSDLRTGTLDLVVGTHKLLQKDVEFHDLGLLIVDEEQRFGVTHKEKLKELARGVDVLTLSATPIPRTLNMALSGLRDMSTIEEPPHDRYPVQTFVLEYASTFRMSIP